MLSMLICSQYNDFEKYCLFDYFQTESFQETALNFPICIFTVANNYTGWEFKSLFNLRTRYTPPLSETIW